MGLLDQVAGSIGGSMIQRNTGGNPILGAVMELVGQRGGLSGLLNSFSRAGLGDAVNSWVSTGKNRPVSSDDVRHALGDEEIQAFASQTGLSRDEASGQLADVLPQVVDKLTPEGRLPEDGDSPLSLELLKTKLLG